MIHRPSRTPLLLVGIAALALVSCGGDDKPYGDSDGDGYFTDEDCADRDTAIHPGAAEICDDNFDNDCDGLNNRDDPDCEDSG